MGGDGCSFGRPIPGWECAGDDGAVGGSPAGLRGTAGNRDELLLSRRLGLPRIRTAAVAKGREAGAGSAGAYRIRGERADDGGLAPGDLASPRRGLAGLWQAARQRDSGVRLAISLPVLFSDSQDRL